MTYRDDLHPDYRRPTSPGHIDPIDILTARERDILERMSQGLSNNGISAQLYLSAKTVEAHVSSIFAKLGIANEWTGNQRVQAVVTWLRAAAPD